MKKILLLFILIFSVSLSQAQTLQNPTFGNVTINTLKIKTPATVTSVNFLSTVEADGSISKISPVNLGFALDSDVVHKSGSETITGNKTFTGTVSVQNPTAATHAVTKSYADGLIVGLLNDRGSYNASTNLFPTTGGSGTSGAILKGDIWFVSVAGTLGGKYVAVGDSFRALTNTPGQTAGNWSLLSSNLSYVPANDANVIHRTGGLNETADGIKTFDNLMLSANPINSVTNTFGQLMGGTDNWRIYGFAPTIDNSALVFEVGDNGANYASGGERFEFRYKSLSGTTDKTVLLVDYTEITADANINATSFKKTGGTASQFLKADGSVDSTIYYPNSNPSGYTSNTGTLTGSGTANYISKWSSGVNQIDSQIYDNGSTVAIGTTSSTGKFQVRTGTNENISFLSGSGKPIISALNDAISANVGMSFDASDYTFMASAVPRLALSNAGVFRVLGLSGTGTRTVVADASGNLSATDIAPTSGTYTPTLTAGSNVATIVLTGNPTYTRIGNVINVTVGFNLTVTATGNSVFTITLPFNRIATTSQIVGTGATNNNSGGATAAPVPVIASLPASVLNAVTCSFYANISINTFAGSVTYQYSI